MTTYRNYDEIPQDVFADEIYRLAREHWTHTLNLPGIWEIISEEFNNDALNNLCPGDDDDE